MYDSTAERRRFLDTPYPVLIAYILRFVRRLWPASSTGRAADS